MARRSAATWLPALGFAVLASLAGNAARADEAETLASIRNAAMASDWAWQRLADLTDLIGPRLTGSPQAEAAVAQVAAAMKGAGLDVRLQPVRVPHWVRGEERAELVDYPGRPAGIVQSLHMTTLGGAGATPPEGLTRPLSIVHSVDEMVAQGERLRGRIVLIDTPFDQNLADNGQAGPAYVQAGMARFTGPTRAVPFGIAAVLVRSIGGADYRLPHTGEAYGSEHLDMPSAALSAEDAALIERLAARGGPITMRLLLRPQYLPEVDSHNVIADLRGGEKPDEVVIVSGHLDSWDLGTGAADDGAGVVSALAAVALIKQLGLVPKRTIRAIAWMNEESEVRGGKAYFASVKDQIGTQFAAIESDNGASRPLGIRAYQPTSAMPVLEPLREALRPLGATVIEHQDRSVGEDIELLQKAGVPGYMPMLDVRHYFDYHHTAADTLDKVDPDNLRRQVAVMAMLAWRLANLDGEELPRQPVAGQ